MKKLVVLLLLLALGIVGYTSYQHHQRTGAWPWASQAEFQAYLKQTKQQSKTLAQQAQMTSKQLAAQAKASGNSAWKWTTKNSQTLFDKSKGLLAKLGASEAETAAGDAATGATAGASAAPAQASVDPLDQRSSNYKYGREWLRKGVAEWKVGLIQPGAARRAHTFLGKAVYAFEAAKQDLGGHPKVEEYLTESRTYLNDAAEMVAKIDAAEKAAAESTTGTH